MGPSADHEADDLTIDELASAAGTTARHVRSLQTLGLLPHPQLRGRTGLYGPFHLARLRAILGLQDRGFSLESLGVLFAALEAGESLGAVLGLEEAARIGSAASTHLETSVDTAELYGFADLEPARASRRRAPRPLLSLVPTTMWDESEAS
ncbi:MAG TPA: MerR family transcriptional regulator [Acidimicrobiales bacterium]|nr:MerR family transcriptional regulator [Acidimicrobiales bacterium]